LARLYSDDAALAAFVADPRGQTERAGLLPEEAAQLCQVDRSALGLAARSFARKRAHQAAHAHRGWWRRLRAAFDMHPRRG
jgi:hypothetical protein